MLPRGGGSEWGEYLNNEILSINEFKSRAYPVLVHQSSESFNLFVPSLSIYINATTPDEAFIELDKEKVKYYKRLENFDSLHLIPELTNKPSFFRKDKIIKIIFEKTISFLLALFLSLLLVAIVFHQLNKSIGKVSEAFNPVESQKKEERLDKFKEKLKVASPYIREIKKVINE